MSDERWEPLDTLPPGSLFVTANGILAVKSEYKYSNGANSQWLCVLLASGEYAHFEQGNETLVRQVPVEPVPPTQPVIPAEVAATIEEALTQYNIVPGINVDAARAALAWLTAQRGD